MLPVITFREDITKRSQKNLNRRLIPSAGQKQKLVFKEGPT
jgi:hypothetical protein